MKMKPTEKAEITIAAQYAFKDKGFEGPKGKVPGGGTVIYTVELLSIEKVRQMLEKRHWQPQCAVIAGQTAAT